MGRRNIPDGWLDYYPMKEIIWDARIVPFKCPLPEYRFREESMVQHKWTPADVMYQIPNLGLVIDLTFKQPPYYNPDEFTRNGVGYKKILCEGHFVPNDTAFYDFVDTVESFLWNNAQNHLVIGVHCTHGVNRTGYMLCRYMVERMRYRPDFAIHVFGVKRGYPLERENYKQAIYEMSPAQIR